MARQGMAWGRSSAMNAKRKPQPPSPVPSAAHRRALQAMTGNNRHDYTDREMAAICGSDERSKLCSDLYHLGYVKLSDRLRRCKVTDKFATTYIAKEGSK